MKGVQAVGACQVEDHAALAAEPQRARGQLAEAITARRLDLDDVCAEVGESHRGESARWAGRGVDDTNAVEGAIHPDMISMTSAHSTSSFMIC